MISKHDFSKPQTLLSPQDKRLLLGRLLREKASSTNSLYPLSYGQQALWFLYQSAPESSAYNTAFAVRIRSNVDVPALKSAFQKLVNRHPSLRTTFPMGDGSPVQKVHGYQEVCFEEIDASSWSWDELNRKALEAYQRPFDLEGGPVLRVTLFSRSARDRVLLLTIHHIVSDGWSLWMLLEELRVLYPAQTTGQKAFLPPGTRSYPDYIQWQTDMLASSQGEQLWNYWKNQLAGELPTLDLPTDRPRAPIQTYRGASYPFKVNEKLTQQLKRLAQNERATLYMTLLAAFQVLLYRYTGQEDILVGSPTAARNQSEFAGTVGYFVNPVVLRGNLAGNPTFKDFLGQVRQTTLEAIAHQDYPFPLLVERLLPNRDPSYSPLFQVLFVLQKPQKGELAELMTASEPEVRVNWGGLQLEPFLMATEEGQFDLTLEMVEVKESLVGIFKYNTDLFDDATITRMAGHFQTLLESIVANPEQCLADFPLLTAAERQTVLVEWNDTRRDYPYDIPIHQLFETRVQRTPDAVALVFEQEKLTYQALNCRANQLAHYLQNLGVGPEVLVGICVERSLEMVVGLLAILKAGGAYVPLDPDYPQERLNYMLCDARVPVLLTTETLTKRVSDYQGQLLWLDKDWEIIGRQSRENPVSGVGLDNLAYVIYTSGSTGKPKGAANVHRGISNRLLWMQDTYQLTTTDRILQKTPFSFDVSVWEFFWPLLTGACLVVAKPNGHQDSAYLVKTIAEQQITTVHFVPSMLQVFLEEPGLKNCHSLRRVICSGEALSFDLQERFFERLGCELHNLYGPTEAAIDVTFWQCDRSSPLGTVPIGRPIANTQIYILDPHLQPVPIGVAGELHIGGVNLARGYLNRPDLTAEKFIANPLSQEAGARLYKTGDLARYLPDGTIEYLGRIDHQVKIRGFRIELGEIEAVLAQHPKVRETVVIARNVRPGHEHLVAYVVPPQEPPASNELRRFLKEKLPDYMVPSVFVVLDALPLTPNGKVNRRVLPAPDISRMNLEVGFVAPRTPTEKILADIWAEVLRVEQVGIHDNFFELGGDSILSIQIIARANQAGLKLATKQLFQHQTIAELAAVVGTVFSIQAEQGLVTGPVPLTPIQHWFFEPNLPEPHHFNIAFLLEVSPNLKPELLEQVVQELLVHHDALRLRFVQDESIWHQVNFGVEETVPFIVVDFSKLSSSAQQAAIEATAAELQASLNLSEGPLMRAALFNLGINQPGRLLLVIHHLAVDGVSWRILLEDLATAYQQLDRGETIQLPSKTTSFKDWANRLTEYAQSEALAAELDYWLAESSSGVAPLPVDYPSGREANTVVSARTLSVSLGEEQTRALLQEVPQVYNTQINDVLVTALVQSFAQWTGEHSLLVNLEGHGREELFEEVDLSRTVGWFTSIFPVRLKLQKADHLGEALKSVKEQLRRVPNRGIGYGILRYLSQDTGTHLKLQALPQPEVSFNYLGRFDQMLSAAPVLGLAKESSGSAHSSLGRRYHLLEVNGFVISDKLRLDWTYSEKVHRRATVERLAQSFMEALQALIAHCQSPEAGGYTPSDFPDVELSQEKLDQVLAEIDLFNLED